MLHSEGIKGLVWIVDERVFGRIVGPMGAYYSNVVYTKDGIDYEVLMENDEFQLVEEWIDYEEE